MTSRIRTTRAAGAALLAGATLAVASPAAAVAAPSTGGDTASVPNCTPADLKIIENDRDAAAGTTYIELALIAIAGGPDDHPCRMPDRIAMHWAETRHGERVGAWATEDGPDGEPFVLRPGEAATVTIAQPNPGNYDPEDCRPTKVAGMQIYLPGDSGSDHVPTGGHDTACANPDLAVPRASAVTPPHA